MIVRWLDAWFDKDETLPSAFAKSCPMETVGWLLREGDVISVAGERSEGPWFKAITHIPVGMVESLEVVG